MAHGPCDPAEFFLDRQVPYFQDYARRYTDMPMLVRLRRDGDRWVPDRYVRQSDLAGCADIGPRRTGRPSRLPKRPASSSCRRARSAIAGRREGEAEGPLES